MGYFSQREYRTFVAASVSHIAVAWFALAGRPLTQQQRVQLEEVLDKFFRSIEHRSFQQHGPTRR